MRRAVLVQFTGEGNPARTMSGNGVARKARRHDRRGSRKVLSRWAHPADCRILRERCTQHVPTVAPARTVPRAIVRCRVSGSEANLVEFVKARSNTKPHLTLLSS